MECLQQVLVASGLDLEPPYLGMVYAVHLIHQENFPVKLIVWKQVNEAELTQSQVRITRYNHCVYLYVIQSSANNQN